MNPFVIVITTFVASIISEYKIKVQNKNRTFVLYLLLSKSYLTFESVDSGFFVIIVIAVPKFSS